LRRGPPCSQAWVGLSVEGLWAAHGDTVASTGAWSVCVPPMYTCPLPAWLRQGPPGPRASYQSSPHCYLSKSPGAGPAGLSGGGPGGHTGVFGEHRPSPVCSPLLPSVQMVTALLTPSTAACPSWSPLRPPAPNHSASFLPSITFLSGPASWLCF
jgi:hypothetical protein